MTPIPKRWVCLSVLFVAACGSPSEQSEEDEQGNDLFIEKCEDEDTLCTYAGTGTAGFDGDGNPLRESMLYMPIDVTITKSEDVYILDWNNHAVRHVDKGKLETVIGTGFVGDGPDDLSDTMPPGVDGTLVNLNHPTQLVEMESGKLWLVSWHNHKLREYDPKTGLVVINCGGAPGYAGDGNPFRGAKLNQPSQMAVDRDGAVYILDMRNQVVRQVDREGIMHTVAGTLQTKGYDGDGGSPLACTFDFPSGSNPPPGGALALDAEGRLYVADSLNNVVRRIDFAEDEIVTVAGNGEAGFDGDGGPATEAQLNNPRDLQFSKDGKTLYIADERNNRIRALDVESGEIETIAGNGDAGYDGEGDAPTKTALNRPAGLAIDGDGMLYIADTYNHRVRRFQP